MAPVLKITLDQWLRTGRIGPLSIGDSVDDVTNLLGATDIVGPKPKNKFPNCWLYDELEFGFDDERKIKWIQSDTVRIEDSRRNPSFVDFDWQQIADEMPLENCKKWLDKKQFRHSTEFDDDGAKLIIESQTQMLFTDPNAPKLVTIWCPSNAKGG